MAGGTAREARGGLRGEGCLREIPGATVRFFLFPYRTGNSTDGVFCKQAAEPAQDPARRRRGERRRVDAQGRRDERGEEGSGDEPAGERAHGRPGLTRERRRVAQDARAGERFAVSRRQRGLGDGRGSTYPRGARRHRALPPRDADERVAHVHARAGGWFIRHGIRRGLDSGRRRRRRAQAAGLGTGIERVRRRYGDLRRRRRRHRARGGRRGVRRRHAEETGVGARAGEGARSGAANDAAEFIREEEKDKKAEPAPEDSAQGWRRHEHGRDTGVHRAAAGPAREEHAARVERGWGTERVAAVDGRLSVKSQK